MSDPTDSPTPPSPHRSAGTVRFAVVVLAGVFAALFVAGLAPRVVRARQLRESSAGLEAPRVTVVKPHRASGAGSVALPGSIEALRDTWIYARASGYVRKWTPDLGDPVEEGQVLLELDTPEIDAELGQARANLAQAQTAVDQAAANRKLAAVTAARYERLGPSGVASQQDVEEKQTQLAVADANVKAAAAAVESQRANVNRLVDLKSFAKVVAPYSGRVTARNLEVGQLVNAGAAGGQGLYRLAQVKTVRVFVHVPQDFAAEVVVGQEASVAVREQPGRTFTGKVSHSAGALDPASRSLTAEVQIPNDDDALLAGMYAQVELQLGNPRETLRVPSAALMAGAQGTRLLTVDGSRKLKWVTVRVGRDLGAEIEIVTGLSGTENVVMNAPAGASEGTLVDVINTPDAHT
jgi:membrane fusion protein (multidrug efflux system)